MSFLKIMVRVGLLAVGLSACASFASRSAWWLPERLPGSARLALEDLRAIYLPPEPSDRLSAAAEDLVQHWPGAMERRGVEPTPSKQAIVLVRDTGSGMGDMRSGIWGRGSGIWDMGWTRVRRSLLRGESFSIRRERTRVYLRAATDEALANGLYAIGRELLGARWYWPGELGFEQVGEVADKFPEGLWRERLAFVQRTLYPVGSDFGRRNGLNRKYSFNHNLARIFTAEVFDESPEVFAEIEGERKRPKQSAKYDPQPDFTERKTVELAAEAARAHFRKNPKANSFSLSINDNSLFDESVATEAVVKGRGPVGGDRFSVFGGRGGLVPENGVDAVQDPLPTQPLNDSTTDMDNSPLREGSIGYFRGRPNYTDLVFGFMNEVAERLERTEGGDLRLERAEGASKRSEKTGYEAYRNDKKPEKGGFWAEFIQVSGLRPQPSKPYLTALAYYWTEQSPSFKLHPRIMPVLTSDRAQWHDPDYRAQDKALIQRWANSGAERIATWDYYFGAPYPYPRQFTQWIGESIKYLHQSGVDVFFSQLPSIWGLDGPKAWLTAELLRDPEQEVEGLLDEYFQNFFGPAAEPIREFYEIAEQTRNARAGTANWIKFYKDEAGIELFDQATLNRMRECIDRAMELLRQESADNPVAEDRYFARVEVVSEAFSYTESYAAYHRSRVRLVEAAMSALRKDHRAEEGVEVVRLLKSYRGAKASFHQTERTLADEPLQGGFKAFSRLKKSDPLPLARAAIAASDIDFEKSALVDDVALLSMRQAWREGKGRFIQTGKNPDLSHSGREMRNFLGPELPVVEGWRIEYRASEGLSITSASGGAASGLRIENADIVSLAQTYPVLGGKTYLLEMDASWEVSPDNRTRVQLNWKSMSGERLRTDIVLRLPNGRSDGRQHLPFALRAPENAYDLKVGIVTNRQYEGDYLEVERVVLGELVPERSP